MNRTTNRTLTDPTERRETNAFLAAGYWEAARLRDSHARLACHYLRVGDIERATDEAMLSKEQGDNADHLADRLRS